MKLPLLGISIIIFIQLGFTAYNAVDRPLASVFRIDAIHSMANGVAELPEEAVNEGDFYTDAAPRISGNYRKTVARVKVRKLRRPANSVPVFTNTVIEIPEAKPFVLQYVAMQRPLDSDINRYPHPRRSVGESDNYPSQPIRSSEKRSFAAKSASVLKKPYDWIKAIGSKFK